MPTTARKTAVRKPRVAVTAKVTTVTREFVQAQANRLTNGYPSALIARILEAYERGNVFCPSCGFEHPIGGHPPIDPSTRRRI